MIQVLIFVGIAILGTWLFLRKRYSYFRSHGISHLPTVPLVGNILKNITRKEHAFITLNNLYEAFPNDRFIGNYEFVKPTIMVKDLNLIKSIGVKDFDHFSDHRPFFPDNDNFVSNSLFGMKGQKWREMRATLSPAFTGSKLRNMVPLMQDCSKSLEDNLIEGINNSKSGFLDVDTRDLVSRYANDVIAICSFGLKTNSIAERNNEFYMMGNLLTSMSFIQFMKFIMTSLCPAILKVFNVDMFSKKASDFFRKILIGTMKQREEQNIYRPDMLQLLMEAQKGTLKHDKDGTEEKDAGFATALESDIGRNIVKQEWSENHILAQALLFFFAGFDTVSSAMVFLLHELALSPEVQERLQREIDNTLTEHGGKLDYHQINQMKYLDMCISEAMRKWPPSGLTDRICLKDYNMGKPNENAPDYIIPAGTFVTIPIYSLHHNKMYFEDPEKFNPDRFSDENKHKIPPFVYMPFGVGPRNCIGSRFALVELKVLTIGILKHFTVSPSPATCVPIELDTTAVDAKIKGGNELRFTSRKKID